jgi:endonuclease/exonuclease/phosphatase family metal-dependent hydrolase
VERAAPGGGGPAVRLRGGSARALPTRPSESAAALLAVLTVIALELLRASGPLVAAAPGGLTGQGLVALAVFAAPLLAWPVGRTLGRRAVPVAVAVLVVLRLALQVTPAPPYTLGLIAVSAALAVLVLAVGRAEGGAAAMGLLGGLAIDMGVRSLFRTWDPLWRPGWQAWAMTGVLCAAALLTAWWSGRQAGAALPAGSRAWVIGPFLGLTVLVLGNPALVAARADFSHSVTSGVMIIGALFAVVVAGELRHNRGVGAVWRATLPVGALLLAGGTVVALLTTGPQVLAAAVVAQLAAALLLVRALGGDGRPDVGHAGLGAGLGFLVAVFPDQVAAVPVVAGALLAVALLAAAGLRRSAPPAAAGLLHEFHLVGACALALLCPVIVLAAKPSPAVHAAGDQVRLLTWNVHHGVAAGPAVDPETIAQVIERHAPDIVMLQEVGRGRPVAGGLDLAAWLSRRLRVDYVWAQAADGRSGNLIMSRMRLEAPRTATSHAGVTVTLRDGTQVRLLTTHLPAGQNEEQARLRQIAALLDERPTVVAGDLNAEPGGPELRAFQHAGLAEAEEVATGAAAFAEATDRPRRHAGWILGTRTVTFRDVAVPGEVAYGGKVPLVATLALPDA